MGTRDDAEGCDTTAAVADNVLPLELDDQIRDAIATASDTGNHVTVAYNGQDGWPHVSRRGSTQVFGPQQLAIWVRKRDDGLAKAVDTRPEVTLFYLDLVERGVVYTFYGRGRVSADPAVNDRVWTHTPEREKDQDAERSGIALDRRPRTGRRSGHEARKELRHGPHCDVAADANRRSLDDRRVTGRTAGASSNDADLKTVTVAPERRLTGDTRWQGHAVR